MVFSKSPWLRIVRSLYRRESTLKSFYGNQRIVLLFALAVLIPLLAACTSTAAVPTPTPLWGFSTPTPTPIFSNPAGSCPIGEERNAINTCVPCVDLEGCYKSSDGMEHFRDQVIILIEEYAEWQYVSMDPVKEWKYVFTGQSEPTGCYTAEGVQEQSSDFDFHYCGADSTVYTGQESLWYLYNLAGDAGTAVGIAHEWGHHIQNVMGVYPPSGLTNAQLQAFFIAKENQADCIAGSWLKYMIETERVVEDDYDDVAALLLIIAEVENPGRTHGTLSERASSLFAGRTGGIFACNDIIPGYPVARR